MSRSAQSRHGWLFGQHDYEILYGPLERSREVDIRALRARPLIVGEFLTFGRSDRIYDVIVASITALADGGWSARCRLVDLQWM